MTDASVHDSQVIDNLLDEGGEFYADSAYTGQKQEKIIRDKEIINCIHKKGYKGRPLTEE